MIRIAQLRLPVHHTERQLREKIIKLLRIDSRALRSYSIVRRSIDARDKGDIRYSYTIDAELCEGKRPGRNVDGKALSYVNSCEYVIPHLSDDRQKYRSGNHQRLSPVIVGCGPAGLFAGLALARAGLEPILIERGDPAQTRRVKVENFWDGGSLDENSNVCFGEGGAGTFSDGKLNTLVKDTDGRHRMVLKTFVEYGADPSILYDQKPHIGTDRLIGIITAMREDMERLGARVLFNARLEDIIADDKGIQEIVLKKDSGITEIIKCRELVLAIGHSARDTFSMLKSRRIHMQPKAFAVGLRIQHPQHMIDVSQFGEKEADFLGPASYKLTERSKSGRGVYSFCMCPGGYVVNASTESGMLTVNGMSYSGRDSETANSALIVTVTPEDFDISGNENKPGCGFTRQNADEDPLKGIAFQRMLERAAYREGSGSIPVQLLEDYLRGRASTSFGETQPRFKGAYGFARLDEAFPGFIHDAISDVMPRFGRKIKGFDRGDAILAGIEGRTSSPVRIVRNERGEGSVPGLYPCGEGAGYAGGITSAAMDGLLAAERIIAKYI